MAFRSFEEGAWATLTVCPCPPFRLLGVRRDESRPVGKAEKAKTKDPGLHSSDRHIFSVEQFQFRNETQPDSYLTCYMKKSILLFVILPVFV
jgi:hypothetical protein